MFARVRVVGRVWLLAVVVMVSVRVATSLRAQSTELEVVQSESTDLAHAAPCRKRSKRTYRTCPVKFWSASRTE